MPECLSAPRALVGLEDLSRTPLLAQLF